MSVHASWLPVPLLVWGLVCSSVRTAPLAGMQNGALERHWETLYSRSLARNPWEKREITRDGEYLVGIKRLRRLYCNVGIGFHIQVLPDGKITGIHNENRYSKLILMLLLNSSSLRQLFDAPLLVCNLFMPCATTLEIHIVGSSCVNGHRANLSIILCLD